MRAILQSVMPAVLVIAVTVAGGVIAGRLLSGPDILDRPTGPKSGSPGYQQVATVDVDGGSVSLWTGRVGAPKRGGCWELVRSYAVGGYVVGSCGGHRGEPWLLVLEDVVAGGTGEGEAVWAIVDHGVPIPVTDGHFLARQPVPTDAVPVELLDDNFQRLAWFADVPVGGQV